MDFNVRPPFLVVIKTFKLEETDASSGVNEIFTLKFLLHHLYT